MIAPNLPEKWKKAIPAFLTGGSFIAVGILRVFEQPVTVVNTVTPLLAMAVGVFLGIVWTPPDHT